MLFVASPWVLTYIESMHRSSPPFRTPGTPSTPYRWLPIYLWSKVDADPATISFETYGDEVRFAVPRSEIVVTPGSVIGGKVRVLVSGGAEREGFVDITIASCRGPRVETLPEKRLSDWP